MHAMLCWTVVAGPSPYLLVHEEMKSVEVRDSQNYRCKTQKRVPERPGGNSVVVTVLITAYSAGWRQSFRDGFQRESFNPWMVADASGWESASRVKLEWNSVRLPFSENAQNGLHDLRRRTRCVPARREELEKGESSLRGRRASSKWSNLSKDVE